MEKQRWKDSEKRREEERRSGKRKSQKKEDAGVRKGRKVAIHSVFPMICGSGGSKSRLAKAAGAEPSGQMRDEKLHGLVAQSTFQSQKSKKHFTFGPLLEVDMSEKMHAIVARSTFPNQNVQNTPGPDHFWKLRCRKSARRCGAKHISKSKRAEHTRFGARCRKSARRCGGKHFPTQNVKSTTCSDHSWRFCMTGARDSAPCQKWAKREGFVAFPNTMASVGHLKRIGKDAVHVAGAIQKTCSTEMSGGCGADFLRGVAFWSIRSSGLLRWFCVTGAALRMTWHRFFVASAALWTDGAEKSQNAFLRGRQLCTQLSIFKGSLAELLCFWCCQLEKLRKSRRIVPHKAVAEVSRIGHNGRGELLWCMGGRANPLMDRRVVGVVFFGVAAMVGVATSPTTAGSSMV